MDAPPPKSPAYIKYTACTANGLFCWLSTNQDIVSLKGRAELVEQFQGSEGTGGGTVSPISALL